MKVSRSAGEARGQQICQDLKHANRTGLVLFVYSNGMTAALRPYDSLDKFSQELGIEYLADLR